MFNGYQGWLDGVRDWIGADNYTDAQIQQFLFLAQLRLNRELMAVFMEERIQLNIATAGPIFPGAQFVLADVIPDFNKIHNVGLAGYGSVQAIPSNEMTDWYTFINDSGATGVYKYRIWAGTLGIQPGLVDGDSLSVQYYKTVEYLSDTVDNNEFTDNCSDMLITASCLAAAPYMIEDERIPVWKSDYAEALEAWNENPKKVRMGSTPLVRNIRFG
jgi:hypothetical protein